MIRKEKRTDKEWHQLLPGITDSFSQIFSALDLDEDEQISILILLASKIAYSCNINYKDFERLSNNFMNQVYENNKKSESTLIDEELI